jgi:hypothetical protein
VASSDVTAGASGPDRGPGVFEQGPRLPPGVPGLPVPAALAIIVWEYTRGDGMDARGWLALAIVCGGLFVVIAVAVLPQAMKSIRVDHRGLHVRDQLALHARDIGRIETLSGGSASTQSWPISRNRGLNLRSKQNLYGGLYGWGPAVGIEELDRHDDRVSSWLIPTREPDAFAAALEHARDHARRPR